MQINTIGGKANKTHTYIRVGMFLPSGQKPCARNTFYPSGRNTFLFFYIKSTLLAIQPAVQSDSASCMDVPCFDNINILHLMCNILHTDI